MLNKIGQLGCFWHPKLQRLKCPRVKLCRPRPKIAAGCQVLPLQLVWDFGFDDVLDERFSDSSPQAYKPIDLPRRLGLPGNSCELVIKHASVGLLRPSMRFTERLLVSVALF